MFLASILHIRFRESTSVGIRASVHSKLLGSIQGVVQEFHQTRGGQLGLLDIGSTRIRDKIS